MSNLRNLILFLIGASICFDEVVLPGGFTIAFLLTLAYVLVLIPLYKNIQLIGKYRKYYVPLILFIILLFIMNLLHPANRNIPVFPRSIFFNIVLMLLICLHSEYSGNRIRTLNFALNGIIAGCLLTIYFYTRNIGITIDSAGQFTMFGQNINKFALILNFGMFLVFNILLNDTYKVKYLKYTLIVPLIYGIFMVLNTGSRVSFISLIGGIVVLIVFNPASNKWLKILLSLSILFFGFWIIQNLEDYVVYGRIMKTIQEGSTSGREDLWEMIIPQAMENPILGVGQTGYSFFNTLNRPGFSPHNVLIEVFAYTGIVGLIIMIIFWYNVFKSALMVRCNSREIIPLLFCIPILGEIFTGQCLADKTTYIAYSTIVIYNYQFVHCRIKTTNNMRKNR